MSKHNEQEVNLIADTDDYTLITAESHRTFLDQQKWFLLIYLYQSLPNELSFIKILKETI